MTIGAWIGAGVGLVGLFITIAKLIVTNTASNTRLACAVENLARVTDENCKINTREHEAMRSENQREHEDLWGKVDEHGGKLADHETRIQIIERTPKRRTAG